MPFFLAAGKEIIKLYDAGIVVNIWIGQQLSYFTVPCPFHNCPAFAGGRTERFSQDIRGFGARRLLGHFARKYVSNVTSSVLAQLTPANMHHRYQVCKFRPHL